MPIAIALIRGINVGGKHTLPMGTLRSLCEGLGWRDVATYIQSGNVVFGAAARDLVRAGAKLEAAIENECGFRPGVVVRPLAELRGAMAANPFVKEARLEPGKLLVIFLAGTPGTGAGKAVAALKPDPERVALVGREVFLYYPDGIGASKFQFGAVEKAVGIAGTCRNWNTVTKMLAMAEGLGATR